jgi:hypothetical protein
LLSDSSNYFHILIAGFLYSSIVMVRKVSGSHFEIGKKD